MFATYSFYPVSKAADNPEQACHAGLGCDQGGCHTDGDNSWKEVPLSSVKQCGLAMSEFSTCHGPVTVDCYRVRTYYGSTSCDDNCLCYLDGFPEGRQMGCDN